VAGDMGGALGAAMEVLSRNGLCDGIPFRDAYWGPGFDDKDIHSLLRRLGISADYVPDPAATAADLITRGKVVGWFQGRMEVGPRALGNRSILALPTRVDLRDRINSEVKNREPWRPFSPSVLSGAHMLSAWDRADSASPFMTVALRGTRASQDLSAVLHKDGTSRVHAVEHGVNARYEKVLAFIGQQTSHPVVLNTSLNGRDEPIACRPGEAVRVFVDSSLDALILGRSLLVKSHSG